MPRKLTTKSLAASVNDNSTFTGSHIKLPSGTTAQRPATPSVGMVRYNTDTGYFETYSLSGWGAIATPPSITTVTPLTYNGEQGTTFTISGSFFDSGASVKFITNSGVEYTAATVSYINSGQLTATTPRDFTVAEEPLSVKVINASSLSAIISSIIDCGGTPTWNTIAGTVATRYYPTDTAYSTSISASDPDSAATISYAITSGSLPTGAALNTSTGDITGVVANPAASVVTDTFTATATDNAGNSSSRVFSIIRKWQDGSASDQAATSAAAIKAINSSVTSGVYWLKSSGINGGTPFQIYCDYTMDGGIGYAIYFNKYFDAQDNGSGNGFEAGPNFTSMQSTAITGTAGYSNEYNIYPYLMPAQYNNGSGASKMIIFVRTNAGNSSGGIHSATYKYNRLTGLSTTAMRDIWTSYPGTNAYSASFTTFGNTGTRDSGSGTTYWQGTHGSSGGVVQCVSDTSSVNDKLVFEYKPVGVSEDSTKTDPNHYWMIDNGTSGAAYFRGNGQYGNSVSPGAQASGTFGIRYGGIAIY